MFISEYLGLDSELIDLGVFDSLLDKDSHFFINVICLKKSHIQEFEDAYKHMNQYFSEIATLLDAADAPKMSDKIYREARRRFTFHEVNGINLGFSESRWGSGWGAGISDQVLYDAFQIVKKGSKQPEIFHLVSLFEDNVAGDRLSDMLATIIEPYIVQYTLRILEELNINKQTRPKLQFRADGLIQNPYKNAPILMLPEEVLHELPIAKDWDDIGRVASENNTIRREISEEIGAEWKKWASSVQKSYLRNHVFMKPDVCERVIEGYRSKDLSAIDVRDDPDYLAETILKKIRKALPFDIAGENPSSFDATMDVINIFKDWVENNRGWAEIQDASTKKREKAVQRFMHLGAKYYLKANNLDSSFECDAGNGAVDLKISQGTDKTVAEIKLSTNSQYLHGYSVQVERYGKAENTQKLIYVFIDVGNPGRKKTLLALHRKSQRAGVRCPELVIIDSRKKLAASTYEDEDNLSNIEFDLDSLRNIGIEDLDWKI